MPEHQPAHPHEQSNRPSLTYLAVCAALSWSTAAGADDSDVSRLAPVRVQGSAPTMQPDAVQTPKFRAPLVDTPQTISVVPSEVLKEQGAQSLQDVLRNVPGITFSSGEGGAGWGDMFTIRGFSGEQSVTIDGARDSALTTRTDVFNMEQAEVFKGTGSVESGVGAIGGSINLVTKTPRLDQFYDFSAALGSHGHRRATVDLNHQIGETAAVRLNAMRHKNEVAGRSHADFDRYGIAPSFSWGLGTATRVTASYFYQKDKNTPDFGVPMSRQGGRMRGIGRDYWGGLSNMDIEETETNSATLRIEHDFSRQATIRNQTRWSQTKRFTYLTTGGRLLNAEGASAPGELIPNPGMSNYWGYDAAGDETYPTGYLAVPRLNPNINAYKGKILANQTDLMLDFHTGSIRHQMTTGLELYEESYRKDPYSRRVPDLGGMRRVIDVRDPSTHYDGPWTNADSTDRSGARVRNIGAYVYDQISLNPHWEIAAGLRYDHYTVNWFDAAGKREPYRQRQGLWSGRLGIIYKPVEHGSIYLSYSQASQPSAAAAASRSGGGAAGGNVQNYSPGKAKTWELGTKWDILDERLSLTAAVFQVEKSNPTDTDPNNPGQTIQHARKERVRGLELGLAGALTPQWSAYGGLALMDGGRILTDSEHPVQEGGKLKNVPRLTANLWTSYAFTPRWDASLGVQYVGKRRYASGKQVTSGSYAGHSTRIDADSYWVANASIGYKVSSYMDVRLNVNNIFNKFYLQQVSSSSDGFQLFGVPGAGRNIVLNADLKF